MNAYRIINTIEVNRWPRAGCDDICYDNLVAEIQLIYCEIHFQILFDIILKMEKWDRSF